MSTGSTTSDERIRQIATLVASVDSAAARQLLLHLPTQTARRVRALAATIGSVSSEEKQKILAEFQKSAASQRVRSAGTSQPAKSPSVPASPELPKQSSAESAEMSEHNAASASVSEPKKYEEQVSPTPDEQSSSWMDLSDETLITFLRGERTAVVAVVVNQLSPAKAVAALKGLPRTTCHNVLSRISTLQEVDPEAMQAIDEYLGERLGDYQQTLDSERANKRRMEALLSAAPAELRSTWAQWLGQGRDMTEEVVPGTQQAEATSFDVVESDDTAVESAAPTMAPLNELYGDAVITTSDTQVSRPAENEADDEPPATIPFSHEAAGRADLVNGTQPARPESKSAPEEQVDRTFIAFEFERILELQPDQLAELLSSIPSQTVLLAMAGSSPTFMQRFKDMLAPADARALQQRLAMMKSISLREIDQAQQIIRDRAQPYYRLARQAAA